jgi:serine/threonine protein kinase
MSMPAEAKHLARMQALFRHPNITFVFDAFEFQHTFYIVCEKCWKPINEFMQSEGFNGRVWLRPIARQLLQAVHYIHCNHFAHQDIHGGNVFIQAAKDDLSPDDMIFTYMLGDLGLAKLAAEMDAENTVLADWMRAPESINPAKFGCDGPPNGHLSLWVAFPSNLARSATYVYS